MSHSAAAGLPPAAAQHPPALQQLQQQQAHLGLQPPVVPAAASQPALHPAAATAPAASQPLAAAVAVTPHAASLPPPAPPAAVPAAAAAAATPPAAAPTADSRFDKCGFAKLLGDNGLEYYFKKYDITLGRKSKASNIDVVLGDSPVLSRQHARIAYAFDTKRWELHVEGKNGITVNGTLYTPSTGPCALNSQDLLQAGDHNFYFLLPKQQRKRAPKGSKVATPAGSEGTAVQQQQQQPSTLQVPLASSLSQQQSVPSPRLGMPPLGGQQQQPQTPAAALGPAVDGPQLGSPVLPGGLGYNGTSSGLNPLKLQHFNSDPLLPELAQFGNGTAGYNGNQPRGWSAGFSMDTVGYSGGLGEDLGDEDPNQPDDMED